jgi:hypothetical protein
MEPKRTTEFLELLDVGTLSIETIRTACNSFHSTVRTEKDCSIDRAIKYFNNYQLDSNIQIDEQYSRPQRWFGPAPHVTTTVIESISTRIVSIAHAHKKNGEIEKKESLPKYCTSQALENALFRLNNITHTTDSSSAMLKYFENALNNKHKKVKHAKDI